MFPYPFNLDGLKDILSNFSFCKRTNCRHSAWFHAPNGGNCEKCSCPCLLFS